MTAHTPTPWQWDGDDLWHFGEAYQSASDPHRFTGVTIDKRLRESDILKANKALIVERVNGWDALRAALREAVENCPCSVAERDSGHRIDCRAPQWDALLKDGAE